MTSTRAARKQGCRAPRSLCVVLGLLALLFDLSSAYAQQYDERAVRAAFVYNLAKYVEWPAASNEFVIGFVGDDEMGEVLQRTLTGKSVGVKSIRIILNPTDGQMEQCDLVYVSQSSPQKFGPVLEKLRNRSALTVGQNDSFARHGGVVGLIRSGDHIQIQINLEAAQQAGLKINSRLLNLAVIVHTAGAGD